MNIPKILIAGVGNELRQDDAFGIEFIKAFREYVILPETINLMEVGIGGIHLVQELHSGYDQLILVDAVDWGLEPWSIHLRELDSISNPIDLPVFEKRNLLADMHYTNPLRALMFARALEVIPKTVYILGCEVGDMTDFSYGMTRMGKKAITNAVYMLAERLNLTVKL